MVWYVMVSRAIQCYSHFKIMISISIARIALRKKNMLNTHYDCSAPNNILRCVPITHGNNEVIVVWEAEVGDARDISSRECSQYNNECLQCILCSNRHVAAVNTK